MHQRKDRYALAYDEGVKRIRNELRILNDRILNDVLAEWAKESESAQQQGNVLELTGDRADLQRYITKSARRVLRLNA